MQDYEKLGTFYLGKSEVDGEVSDDLVLYDSKDLTTHAVIIGMTGSGKTGLGIGMIEEAAMDGVPVIAIDPKGDMGNLLLTFPKLAASDFEPWVNPGEAATKGETPEEFAASQAKLWKKGLASWGQKPARIKTFRSKVDMAIYTPGSNAGLPLSILDSFAAPDASLREDLDLYRERVAVTATGILTLLGINADPVTSREHILISNVLDHFWQQEEDLDLPGLIGQIQDPPISKIGVMALDKFYPAKDRFTLAMQLNNLLGAPGFEAWMQGQPLDSGKLLYTDAGKPRISVVSIAHLSESERMFMVCALLNNLIGWMRAQPGTSSLRAILYMDEVFGYLPPIANPPSKTLFLTLLKQARAYGLGLVLSTQNPVDLDYKALSNAGTWMLGRLQTERDKARVMEGLEGVAAGAEFDRDEMEKTLAGLGKRRFLLHNVHESKPVVFNTRWVMSYLAGPLTRDQIKTLMAKSRKAEVKAAEARKARPVKKAAAVTPTGPSLPDSISQVWLPSDAAEDEALIYYPYLVGVAEFFYSSARYKIECERALVAVTEAADSAVTIDWDNTEIIELSARRLAKRGRKDAEYGDVPANMHKKTSYTKWTTAFKRWLRNEQPITLRKSAERKMVSGPEESESDFRQRLAQDAREERDLKVEKLRKRYAKKVTTLENRLLRAEQAIERESEQSSKKKLDAAVSIGAAILGAFIGRKKISSTSASKIGTAVKTVGGVRKESSDVERARETAARVREQLAKLNIELEGEIAEMDDAYDAATDELDEILIKPKSTDIEVQLVALAWMPFVKDSKGRVRQALAS